MRLGRARHSGTADVPVLEFDEASNTQNSWILYRRSATVFDSSKTGIWAIRREMRSGQDVFRAVINFEVRGAVYTLHALQCSAMRHWIWKGDLRLFYFIDRAGSRRVIIEGETT